MVGETAAVLRAHGMKATPQRLAVAARLFAAPRHVTPQGMLEDLRHEHPSLSLNTMYQILKRFADAGLLRELEAGGRTWFDSRTDPHDHAICTHCGRIQDVPSTSARPPQELADWEIAGESRIWRGVCPSCRASNRD
ncbi:MAG: Fur family transcriptional regulator [Mariprofundaceae bacterium]